MRCGIILFYALQAFLAAECRLRSTNSREQYVPQVVPISDHIVPVKTGPEINSVLAAGNAADVLAPNEHYAIVDIFKDLGRRSLLKYPYHDNKEKQDEEDRKAEERLHKEIQDSKKKYESEDKKLVPMKASPKFVLAVAKQSKILEDSKAYNPDNEEVDKESLRSGDYWNAVWKEDVKPNILRTQSENYPLSANGGLPKLVSVRTKIMPGTKLYQLISVLRKISPRFLYVMNVNV